MILVRNTIIAVIWRYLTPLFILQVNPSQKGTDKHIHVAHRIPIWTYRPLLTGLLSIYQGWYGAPRTRRCWLNMTWMNNSLQSMLLHCVTVGEMLTYKRLDILANTNIHAAHTCEQKLCINHMFHLVEAIWIYDEWAYLNPQFFMQWYHCRSKKPIRWLNFRYYKCKMICWIRYSYKP